MFSSFWQLYSDFSHLIGINHDYAGIIISTYRYYEPLEAVLFYIYSAIVNVSGPIWYFTENAISPFEEILLFYLAVLIFALIFDFFTLSAVSRRNVQKRADRPSYNKSFVVFFIFARLLLMDIFLFSSLGARISNMNLSKKQILILIFLVQLLRTIIFLIVYLCFSDRYRPDELNYWMHI